jgi:hypothetical protein
VSFGVEITDQGQVMNPWDGSTRSLDSRMEIEGYGARIVSLQ